MEYLKSFTSLFDDEDTQTTTFKIITNEGVYKVKWKYVEVPTERTDMYVRQYNNNIRKFCRDRFISTTDYDKHWDRGL